MTTTSQDADKLALYIRVAHSLRSRLAHGEWPAGAKLPPLNELAEQYEVAVVTIRQAVALLVADGLVSSARGRGTIVQNGVRPIRDDASLRTAINGRLDLPVDASIRVLSRETSSALPACFGEPVEPVYPEYVTVRKLHLLDGRPFSLVNVAVASSIYARFAPGADERAKMLRLVLDQGGLRLQSSRIEMTLVYADQATAALLECAVLSALVRIQSWRIDTTGKLVIRTDSFYRGDKFVYVAKEQDVELEDSDPIAIPDSRKHVMAGV